MLDYVNRIAVQDIDVAVAMEGTASRVNNGTSMAS
jgi:hypothetical protein